VVAAAAAGGKRKEKAAPNRQSPNPGAAAPQISYRRR
jgi:hypothetical protein